LERNAIRVSALLAVVVAVLYAQGLWQVFAIAGIRSYWMIFALGVLIPLVPGILALMGRMTSLLLLAWGWELGVHLPNTLMQLLAPAGPGPERGDLVITVLALVGLALYLFAAYRQRRL